MTPADIVESEIRTEIAAEREALAQAKRTFEAKIAPSAPEIGSILAERGARYGRFIDHATLSQRIKGVVFDRLNQRAQAGEPIRLDPDQTEAIEMIAHKMARIANGDVNYSDSWRDIAGYATLVADRLDGVAK